MVLGFFAICRQRQKLVAKSMVGSELGGVRSGGCIVQSVSDEMTELLYIGNLSGGESVGGHASPE